MNDTTNVRNWVFLTLQKRPLCDATQPLSISNVAKEAIFETFETQHFRDKAMSAFAQSTKPLRGSGGGG
ncbi:hypothetical protein [Sphingomonas sp. CFBP 8765]|uniref:hypothetical protein n=1 Tax=Sphingomonas sp. CFBP 8765 TaxID=2775274 RepID=UPI0017872160|nr:hypothetical protein [Sphingomonas sp. CFBP 8765]MBD8471522.1 hypothetical protein [Sphingomonas sp. CFBP 8765]